MKAVGRIGAAPAAEPENVTPPAPPPLLAVDSNDLMARMGRIEQKVDAVAAKPVAPEAVLARPLHPLAGFAPYLLGALTTAGVNFFARGPHGLSAFEAVACGCGGALIGLAFVGIKK